MRARDWSDPLRAQVRHEPRETPFEEYSTVERGLPMGERVPDQEQRKDLSVGGQTYNSPRGHSTDAEEERTGARPLRTPRALVVDDYQDTRAILIDVLVSHGFRVETAEDGVEALAKARTWKPDVAVLDLSMPGLDGFEVARRLKSDDTTRHLPLVAYTAHTDPEYRSRALEAGFDSFLVKPTPPGELISELQALLPEPARRVARGAEPDPDDTWVRLAAVREAYRAALALRVQRLTRTWQDLRAAREPDATRIEALGLELHRLIGSGSTHGLPELSRRAGKIEQAFAAWCRRPSPGNRAEVDCLMDELHDAAARWGTSS